MRRRTKLAWTFSTVLASGSAAVMACGAFGGASDEPAGSDSGIETSESDGNGLPDAPAPDASSDAPVVTPALCPPPAAPTCAFGACQRRPLYVPDSPSFPFEIATDSAHVYWLEQRDIDPGVAYNGNGKARVLRVDRVGSPNSARAEVLAIDEPSATAIALAPPYLYWATWDGSISTSTLRRVSAACAAPCQAESVGSFSQRIGKLVGVGTTAVVALASDGSVVHFGIGAGGAVAAGYAVMKSSKYPGIAVTGADIYASGLLVSKISRADLPGLNVTPAWVNLALDGGDGGDLGLSNVATDCTHLFGFHGPGGRIERVSLADGGVSRVTSVSRAVYGVAADAKYFYIGSLNGGGVVAVDTANGSVEELSGGSSWGVAVDSAGVYWGDHPNAGGGTLTMLVK
jgi:hypothetical protein